MLVVEDNPLAGELLAKCFRESRYEVTLCTDGNQALERIAAGRFDLVLLDIMLPGSDGLQVLQQIRSLHSPTTLPVIMTTGVDHSSMIVRALELGANDYVSKPYDIPVLRARVQTHLSIKRMVEQTRQLEQSLTEAYGRLKDDLKAAARVQKTLLPRVVPSVNSAQFAWVFRPCEELAGDTLNVFSLDADHVGLYLLDVSGHGVTAAMLAVQVSRVMLARDESSILLHQAASGRQRKLVPVVEVADTLNRRFPFESSAGQFFTLIYGILNTRSGELRYVCAGHPGPAHVTRKGEATILKAPGLPIGLAESEYKEHVLQLHNGDRLYLYTDGVTESLNVAGEQFGEERLLAALSRNQPVPLEEGLSATVNELEQWQARALDDVSILALEWVGTGSRRSSRASPTRKKAEA